MVTVLYFAAYSQLIVTYRHLLVPQLKGHCPDKGSSWHCHKSLISLPEV